MNLTQQILQKKIKSLAKNNLKTLNSYALKFDKINANKVKLMTPKHIAIT